METVFLQDKPTIRVVDSTITKAIPRDLIIHAVQLSHKGHVWHITVQRHQLRELFKNLKQVRYGTGFASYFKMPLSGESLWIHTHWAFSRNDQFNVL